MNFLCANNSASFRIRTGHSTAHTTTPRPSIASGWFPPGLLSVAASVKIILSLLSGDISLDVRGERVLLLQYLSPAKQAALCQMSRESVPVSVRAPQ